MGFVITALSNTRFLCGAIVVTALAMMLWDLSEVAEEIREIAADQGAGSE